MADQAMTSPSCTRRSGQVLTSADRLAILRYPELARLVALRSCGEWLFQPVLADEELKLVVGSRSWLGGWSDALAIRSRTDAKAFRCDPVGGVVWQKEGGLVEVVEGLLELPGPEEPGAPRLVKARAPRLWVPGGKDAL
jgi:hypothetical protein